MNYLQQIHGAKQFIRLASEGDSLSGTGSTLESTRIIREWFPVLVKQLGIKSILDIPCGDHHWMSTVELDCEYRGADAIKDAVRAAKTMRPDRRFEVINAITDPLPQVDLIFCRDLFPHLTWDIGMEVLANFLSSKSRYLAATNFPDVKVNPELWESHEGWGWRRISMAAEPFYLPPPVAGVCEGDGKWLNIYDLGSYERRAI